VAWLAGAPTLRRAVLMCCTSGDELCPADKRPASIQRRLIWALCERIGSSLPAALSRSGGRNQLWLGGARLPKNRPALARSLRAFALAAGATKVYAKRFSENGSRSMCRRSQVASVFFWILDATSFAKIGSPRGGRNGLQMGRNVLLRI
jgi:hypothetical protein